MRGLLAFASVCFALAGCSGAQTGEQGSAVTITEVTPAQGPVAGDVPIQIKGTGFSNDGLLVSFGDNFVDDAQAIDANTIQGTLPPNDEAGLVDVEVACADGRVTLQDGFQYSEAAGE